MAETISGSGACNARALTKKLLRAGAALSGFRLRRGWWLRLCLDKKNTMAACGCEQC